MNSIHTSSCTQIAQQANETSTLRETQQPMKRAQSLPSLFDYSQAHIETEGRPIFISSFECAIIFVRPPAALIVNFSRFTVVTTAGFGIFAIIVGAVTTFRAGIGHWRRNCYFVRCSDEHKLGIFVGQLPKWAWDVQMEFDFLSQCLLISSFAHFVYTNFCLEYIAGLSIPVQAENPKFFWRTVDWITPLVLRSGQRGFLHFLYSYAQLKYT